MEPGLTAVLPFLWKNTISTRIGGSEGLKVIVGILSEMCEPTPAWRSLKGVQRTVQRSRDIVGMRERLKSGTS
jgi:hypothetical protein